MKPIVIITHGLGNHPRGFSEKLKREITSRVDAELWTFFYHDLFQGYQEEKFKKYKHLGNRKIRKFIFENVADGVTYHEPVVYKYIHSRLMVLIDQLNVENRPIAIIAPSLGGKVIMDHIWDNQKSASTRDHMRNLKLFITNGCNIPLFVSGLSNIEHISQDFKWINFYDRQDVLGFPLAPLGYEAEDIEVKTHAWLLSHLRYWKNRKFLDRICAEIGLL